MFKLGNLTVDHIAEAVASDISTGEVLYTLTQLNTATIEVSADSSDTVDKYGNLVKRIYKAKSCTFTATNAMLDINALAGQAGNPGDGTKTIADPSLNTTFEAPKIVILKKADAANFALEDLVEGTLSVTGLDSNNAKVESYKINAGGAAAQKQFAITDGKLQLPTSPDTDVTRYMLVYQRTVKKGIKVVNSAKNFAKTVDLIVKALCFDPCSPGDLRALYIEFPSFQPSPEVSFELTADATQDFSGDAQIDYCGPDKAMYILTWADEDDQGIDD